MDFEEQRFHWNCDLVFKFINVPIRKEVIFCVGFKHIPHDLRWIFISTEQINFSVKRKNIFRQLHNVFNQSKKKKKNSINEYKNFCKPNDAHILDSR